MSTVSDLTTSLSNVSLSRRSTAFTLVSSDGQRFDIDSAVLAFHSKVFADMFETVGESDEAHRTCDLAEDGATVKIFLEALLQGIPPSTEEAWLSVFSLMDKYECKALKTPLLLAGWFQLCSNSKSIWAYAVGCHLGDIDLAWTALREAANYTDLRRCGAVFDALPQKARSIFMTYLHERTEKARSILENINFGKVCGCARVKDERDCDKGVWETVVLTVCSRLHAGEDVITRVREEIWSRVGQWGDCHRCGKKLHKKVKELAGRLECAQQNLANETLVLLSATLATA